VDLDHRRGGTVRRRVRSQDVEQERLTAPLAVADRGDEPNAGLLAGRGKEVEFHRVSSV
jgi:hypothetical protein